MVERYEEYEQRHYGVLNNSQALSSFRHQVGRRWCRALRRRGNRKPITWARMERHLEKCLLLRSFSRDICYRSDSSSGEIAVLQECASLLSLPIDFAT